MKLSELNFGKVEKDGEFDWLGLTAEEYEGKKVSIGIRSERFLSGKEHENRFKAVIEVVEMLGKEKSLYVKLSDGSTLVITMPGHYNYEPGEEHNFGFDTEALHFFDENGDRI